MHLEDLARLRQLAYRLFSSALLYPEERRLEALAGAASELRGAGNSMLPFAFFSRWQRLLAVLADPPDAVSLGEEYLRVFMYTQRGTPCLPYESVYVDPGGQATGWVLALVEREYAAAGLALLSSPKEAPDHVAVELEFIAFLCGQEADAWNRGVLEEGVQALERQAAFLGEHLARWVPEWARRVATAHSDGVYPVVAEATQAFISHDRDLTGVLLEKYRTIPQKAQIREGHKTARNQQPLGSYRHAG